MSSTKQNTVANAFRHHLMRGVSTTDDRSRNAGDVLRDDILKQIETATEFGGQPLTMFQSKFTFAEIDMPAMLKMWNDDTMARHLGFESAYDKANKIKVTCVINTPGLISKDRDGENVVYQIRTITVTIKWHNEDVEPPYCTFSGMGQVA